MALPDRPAPHSFSAIVKSNFTVADLTRIREIEASMTPGGFRGRWKQEIENWINGNAARAIGVPVLDYRDGRAVPSSSEFRGIAVALQFREKINRVNRKRSLLVFPNEDSVDVEEVAPLTGWDLSIMSDLNKFSSDEFDAILRPSHEPLILTSWTPLHERPVETFRRDPVGMLPVTVIPHDTQRKKLALLEKARSFHRARWEAIATRAHTAAAITEFDISFLAPYGIIFADDRKGENPH